MKGKRIEIYKSFDESEKAMLANYAELTPQQCWFKAHELSECFRQTSVVEEHGTFILFLSK